MSTMRSDLQAIAHQAMIDRGLLPEFTEAQMEEAEAVWRQVRLDIRLDAELGVGPDAMLNDGGQRDPAIRDLRSLPWCSIDNDDSRDLDQLSVAQPAAAGTIKILVAIADVDARVAKGAALDQHAATNTTSVYTDVQIFPMLPEALSTDVTSLNQGEERLAVVVEMVIAGDGAVTAQDVYRAAVVNHAKLAYDAVAVWLEGAAAAVPARIGAVPGLAQNLRMQDVVAQKLKERRHQHGALGLETIEPRAVFDGDTVTDLRIEQKNRARNLIEDFMVAANVATARFLDSKGFPSLRRVLRSPERWSRIVALAKTSGGELPAQPDARALDEFLSKRRRADPPRFPDLSLAVVKLLGRGEYAVELPGPGQRSQEHFGLAVKDYTHATAPNRRYPDLVTQRLIKAALAGSPAPYAADELAALARHCTVQEDNAAKVERRVRKSAGALLLQDRIGHRFEGIVTGVSAKGTWVRLLRPLVEGRVVRGFQGMDVGDRVAVKLEQADVQRGFIDFVR